MPPLNETARPAITAEDIYVAAQLKGRMLTRLDRGICRRLLEDKKLAEKTDPALFSSYETEQLLTFAMKGIEEEKSSGAAIASQKKAEEEKEEPELTEEERLLRESFHPAEGTPPGIEVLVSESGLFAKLCLVKPKEDEEGQPPPAVTASLLEEALQAAGVTAGVDKIALARLEAQPVYDEDVLVAKGTPAKNGVDGKLIYHFETEQDLSPKVDAQGNVDYKNLQYAQNVAEGDLLCEIVLPTAGIPGVTVRGEAIPAKNGATVPVPNGKNTVLSGDGTKITAGCDGQVTLKNNKISISKMLLLENVDASTGNILFVGSVSVSGDVRGGFTIRVGGDIKVSGIVENATLVAGGNIALNKGINHGSATAGGSLRARFIESATVNADGDVFADVLLNSTVTAKGNVKLSGSHSCIVGGRCSADNRIDCKEIGNDANIPTEIALTGQSRMQEERDKKAELRTQYPEAVGRVTDILLKLDRASLPDNAKQNAIARAAYLKLRFEQALTAVTAEVEELDKQLRRQSNGLIIVRSTLYPNVTFRLNGVTGRNQEIRKFCTAALRQGKVTFGPATGL
ncbi:MAG: FapA family protein [Oscillospiraceae bacterium]|nr:FapA family protein [Oscillospiraceae bacterium]